MSCLLAPYPDIINTAHPQLLTECLIRREQIGKFSHVDIYARVEATLRQSNDDTIIFDISAPETMLFIYEH